MCCRRPTGWRTTTSQTDDRCGKLVVRATRRFQFIDDDRTADEIAVVVVDSDVRFADAIKNIGAVILPGDGKSASRQCRHAGCALTSRTRGDEIQVGGDHTADVHTGGTEYLEEGPVQVPIGTLRSRARVGPGLPTDNDISVAQDRRALLLVGVLKVGIGPPC